MILFLDNAESILDPQETDAGDMYAMVEELSRFSNISLCITSRISIVPPHCNRLKIPTLSMESACDIFYGIYKDGGQSDSVKDLVQQLEFHALSITLLATTAAHSLWDYDRLVKEWNVQRSQVLRTEHNESLAATIELSLTSPTFRKLGPNARELLGVVAFFPQGIDENNFDWLFPTISNRKDIFDKFCVLSLTHRSNGFITMLAPLRDYLGPRDPRSSPLLCTTRNRYSNRLQLLGNLEPDQPGFKESRWIRSEDVNVEHLLDIFTSFGVDADRIWDTCADFITHLVRHKPGFTILGSKIEGLPDDHHSKPRCLFWLSQLFYSLGNYVEEKRLLAQTLELERGRGNEDRVARTLRDLADANRMLGLCEEGIQQSREALEICKQLGDAEGQGKCWNSLGWLLYSNDQLDAAEGAASHALKLFLDQGREYWVCDSHHLLGSIYCFKGETGKSIHHYEAALKIGSSFDWRGEVFWIHNSLAWLFYHENEFGNAQAHNEQARPYAADNTYSLGHAMDQQAWIWYSQGRLGEAKAEVLRALDTFEKLGATTASGISRNLLRDIELAVESRSNLGDSGSSGEFFGHNTASYTR